MLSTFASWRSLTMYADEEDRRLARIQTIIIIFSWISSLIVILMDLVWGDKSLTFFVILGGISQLFSLFLLLRGNLSASSFLSIGLYIILITVFATFGQGIHDYVIMAYPAIIMFSGLVAQRRGLVMSVFLTSVSLAWLVFGEIGGLHSPRNIFFPHWTDFIAAELLILITALAVYLLVANLEHGLVQTWRELAERKRAEAALARSEQRFESYVRNAPNVITVIDSQNRIQYLNRTEANLPETVFLGKNIFDFVMEPYREEMARALETARQADGQPARYITSAVVEGESQWYENHAALTEPQNPASEIVIISTNITSRKHAEEALRESREMYRLLAENISDVIWIFDVNERRPRYISPSMVRLRGYTPEEVMANDIFEAINPKFAESVKEKILARIAAFQNGYRGMYVDELEQPHKDGSIIWVEATTSFHINEANGHLEMYGVSRNISERKQNQKLLQDANAQLSIRVEEIERLQAELREQAIRDSLTGLYNRRYMEDVFTREFSRAARGNYALSVIMLDLDDLKLINDNYGHGIGDQAIQTLAACLKSTTRREDVVCRYGGDEFTIVVGKATSEDAFRRVEEWRQFLVHHPIKTDAECELQIKFTAGIASFPRHAASMEEIVHYADIALYRAKARGRNCTTIFE